MDDPLTEIHARMAEGRAREAYDLAASAKERILAEREIDPRLLGWLRYYQFKCLFELRAFKEAVDLFRRPEPAPFHLPLKNAAWMHAAAAECAAMMGRAEDVVRWGERAVELRLADGDGAGTAKALNAACLLLERVGRPDLNTPFADRLIELGLRTGAESAVIEGVLRLLESYEAKARGTVRRRLEKGGALLPALRDGRKAAGALERVKQVLTN